MAREVTKRQRDKETERKTERERERERERYDTIRYDTIWFIL